MKIKHKLLKNIINIADVAVLDLQRKVFFGFVQCLVQVIQRVIHRHFRVFVSKL